MKKKPPFVSHYLVLKDLLKGVDVRLYSDNIVYLTSRIENIKTDLVKHGLNFVEDAKAFSKYSHYKPYVLLDDKDNLQKARELLDKFESEEILRFLNEV